MNSTVGKWVWPGLSALICLYAFAIPNSLREAPSLLLCMLFSLICAAAWLLPQRESPPVWRRPEMPWLMAGLGIFILTLCVKPLITLLVHRAGTEGGLLDPSAAFIAYLQLGGIFMAFALGFRLSLTDETGRRLMDALLMAGAAWALISIFMHISDPDGVYGVRKIGTGRLTGAFASPNTAATFFGAISVLALGRLISRFTSSKSRRLSHRIEPVAAAALLVCLGALSLTLSRAGILATLTAGVILSFLLLRRSLSLWKWLGLIAACAAVLALIYATPALDALSRFDTLSQDMDARSVIFDAHYDIASKQSWFGSGLGSFRQINSLIMTPENVGALWPVGSLHNVYLQWYEEAGLTGLMALGLLNLAVIVPMGLAVRRRQSMGPRILTVLLAYLVFLLHGFTDFAFQEPAMTFFLGLLMGCGYALATNGRTSWRQSAT
ncbi:MAG: O-antigen ligase family protein [Asticcacaulis sp.]